LLTSSELLTTTCRTLLFTIYETSQILEKCSEFIYGNHLCISDTPSVPAIEA